MVAESTTRNMRRYKCTNEGCKSNGYLGQAQRTEGAAQSGVRVPEVLIEKESVSTGGGDDGHESIFFDLYD
jgi:hypothetical protein